MICKPLFNQSWGAFRLQNLKLFVNITKCGNLENVLMLMVYIPEANYISLVQSFPTSFTIW